MDSIVGKLLGVGVAASALVFGFVLGSTMAPTAVPTVGSSVSYSAYETPSYSTPSPICGEDQSPIIKSMPCRPTFITPARLATFEGHLAVYGPCQEDLARGITCSYRTI